MVNGADLQLLYIWYKVVSLTSPYSNFVRYISWGGSVYLYSVLCYDERTHPRVKAQLDFPTPGPFLAPTVYTYK